MKTIYLTPALLALALLAAVLAGGSIYARWIENRYVHILAPEEFDQKFLGSALQRAAFRQPNLLPVYGSSELTIQKPYQQPYRAITVFRGEPTGFTVFPVGQGDTTDLLMLQRLAAAGADLRGKKVAISLTPTWFYERRSEPRSAYAGNFSRLHAGELAFSTRLSFELKHDVARRMLHYSNTLEHDPLLRFAVENLADGSPASRVRYYLALPLGMLQNLVLRLQDHWEILNYIWSRPDIKPDQPPPAAPPDWPTMLAVAERTTRQVTDTNPFGFDNGDWHDRLAHRVAAKHHTLSDKAFRSHMRQSIEWTDLVLLLRTLRELGARPLLLSMPMNGPYYDYVGVSALARAD